MGLALEVKQDQLWPCACIASRLQSLACSSDACITESVGVQAANEAWQTIMLGTTRRMPCSNAWGCSEAHQMATSRNSEFSASQMLWTWLGLGQLDSVALCGRAATGSWQVSACAAAPAPPYNGMPSIC